MQNYRLFVVFAVLQSTIMVVSMVTAGKIVPLGPLSFSAANLIFPLAYIISDVTTEVYGYRASRKIIWLGFFAMLVASVVIQLSVMLPSIDAWQGQESYQAVLGQAPRIMVASLIAYLVGEWSNAALMSTLKIKTGGRLLWLRMSLSSLVAHLIDSTLFSGVAFLGVFEYSLLLEIILSESLFKLLFELLLLPLTIVAIGAVKKIERADTYDHGIRYRLFSLS